MKTIGIEYGWLSRLLPQGFPYPSSTLISGAGETGKPLVGFAFVSSWLKSGGSVILMPLQYPTAEFVKSVMSKIYKIDLEDYRRRIAYIQFDPSIDGYEVMEDNIIKANLLKPNVWNKTIKKADSIIEKNNLGSLVCGSALNMLLISPTYRENVLKNLETIIKTDKSMTYIFCVSTSPFTDEIKIWEEAADNLIYMRMEKPMRLFLKISRMRGVKFSGEEVAVPISKEILIEIKNIVNATLKRVMPVLIKI